LTVLAWPPERYSGAQGSGSSARDATVLISSDLSQTLGSVRHPQASSVAELKGQV